MGAATALGWGVQWCLFQLFIPGLEAGADLPTDVADSPFFALGGLDGAAFFMAEPLGPFCSISSSELVSGSACGEVQLGGGVFFHRWTLY